MQLYLGKRLFGMPIIFDGEPNSHIFISGTSGSGKTWKLRDLALQAKAQRARVIIFDFSGDLVKPYPQQMWNPQLNAEIIDLHSGEYGIELFTPWEEDDRLEDIRDRIADMIASSMRLTENQWACISDAIHMGLSAGVLRYMGDLYNILKCLAKESDIAGRLLPRIRVLSQQIPSGDRVIHWRVDEPGISIVCVNKIKDKTARLLITEMMMNMLCSIRMTREPGRGIPLVALLDECQHLTFKDESQEVRILREGRKYQFYGWYATQFLTDRKATAALGQAGLHLYFRPDEVERHTIARKLAHGDKQRMAECESKLSKLKVGQFLFWDGKQIVMSAPPNV